MTPPEDRLTTRASGAPAIAARRAQRVREVHQPSPLNDKYVPESLLRRIATGDSSAVDEVLDRYGGLVWSLARRFCANAADAEDAAQEVFIDLWQSARRFDEALASEATFVAMIARRRLIDRYRRSGRRRDVAGLMTDVAENENNPSARAEMLDEVAKISAAMTSLRPEQQQVLKLSIYEGLTHDEIARSTGLPLGTVKTHARRGLMRIREVMGQPAGEAQGGTA
jgi:RNA polymerase sigma factor (sigma-70 family)